MKELRFPTVPILWGWTLLGLSAFALRLFSLWQGR